MSVLTARALLALLISTCLAFAAELSAQPAAQAPLARYLSAADPAYRWQPLCSVKYRGGEYTELLLTSQDWHGSVWRHQLFIIRPAEAPLHPTHAALFITGGHWHAQYLQHGGACGGQSDARVFEALAASLHMPLAVLKQVPEEPLFSGKTEDALIAYSFERYLKSGDDSWPLLLPMVTSAVRAMDAVQAYAQQAWQADIQGFFVMGASKRGWTTWLTAAVDPRVRMIAPISFTMLDIPEELRLQQSVWGKLSRQIRDYSSTGLTEKMQSGKAAKLLDIVDPYHYRSLISQPKLIIDGTNDAYWPVDSINVFWRSLRGANYLLYLPNNGHSPTDFRRLFGDLSVFAQHLATDRPLPVLDWHFERRAGRITLAMSSSIPPARVRIWRAYSTSGDFRHSLWLKLPVYCQSNVCSYTLTIPGTVHTAFFGEAEYSGYATGPLFLSTQVRVAAPLPR